jgi:hypothetical protein
LTSSHNPQRFQAFRTDTFDALTAGFDPCLDGLEAFDELAIGRLEGAFGIVVQLAREHRRGEEQIPEFLAHALSISGVHGDPEFPEFLLDLAHHRLGVVPIKPDTGSFLPKPLGPHERGQPGRQSVQHAAPRLTLGGLFFLLYALPVAQHLVGIRRLLLAKDMGMATDHLLDDPAHHVPGGKDAFLLGQAGEEHDLQQDVPELLAQRFGVARIERLEGLVAFLEQITPQGAPILLAVPRTSPWAAKLVQDFNQFSETFMFVH